MAPESVPVAIGGLGFRWAVVVAPSGALPSGPL